MTSFDPARLAVKHTEVESVARRKIKVRTSKEPFLKGPVPLSWLRRAGKLRGQVLLVGLVLWFRAGVERKMRIKLKKADYRLFGVSERSASRGLASLEKAGVVSVTRHPGRSPIVAILELKPNADGVVSLGVQDDE